jgi:hypothetical protein
MTIKQYGGVFGRNPTFNDVTIDGTLEFNGDIDISSDLKVDGNLDVTGIASFADGSNTAPSVTNTGDSNTGIYFPASDSVALTAGGVATLTSTASAVNIAVPTNIVTAVSTNFAIQGGDGNSRNIVFKKTTGGTQTGKISSINDELIFTAGSSEELRLTSTGISVTGNVIIGTSGKGIDFSATAGSGTSELLDDYEEGTFTPTFSATGLTVTYDSQFGGYTKIGNVVYFRIQLGTDAVSGGSGSEALKISGLPFSAGSVSASSGFGLVYGAATSFADAKWLINSGTSLLLYAGDGTSGSVFSDWLGTGVNSNRTYLTGHYYV